MVANERQKLWYKCLYQFIIDLGFKSVAGHLCLFVQVKIIAGNSYIVIIGIFVDDLQVTGNSVLEFNEVREVMKQCYRLTDQGNLEYYLGVEATQPVANTLMLHQAGYINKILDSFDMSKCQLSSFNSFTSQLKSESVRLS